MNINNYEVVVECSKCLEALCKRNATIIHFWVSISLKQYSKGEKFPNTQEIFAVPQIVTYTIPTDLS